MAMDDIFGLSYHERFPCAREVDNESQLEGDRLNMSLSNNGIDPVSMFMSVPSCELEATELDQYLTMEHIFGLPQHEIFPFDDDLINSYGISEQGNSKAAKDISGLPSTDILSSEENPNLEGGKPISVCPTSDIDEAFHGEKEEELVQLLLLSGELIGEERYEEASEIGTKCKQLSCQTGNATQRLGFYIAAALQERIERQTLRVLNNAAIPVPDFAFNIDAKFDKKEFFSRIAYYNIALPFVNVFQFTALQAIIDVVGKAEKIHVIDLGMRTGSHWAVLMEYLAHRSVSSSLPGLKLLKITAIGTDGEELLKTGIRLHELAKSFAIPLSYNMVEIGGIADIKEGLFSVKSGEALAVYAPIVLRSLLYDPVLLENLLSVINKMRPRILVNVEMEAQHNSPSFVNRFRNVLSHYIAYFDLLDVTMADRNDIMRVKHEELITASQLRNMIVCEGNERLVRHVRTDVWRCFFKHAGFREIGFSFKGIYQARLLLADCASGEHYTLEDDGDVIIIKWKGTPFIALSAWGGRRVNSHRVF